MQHAWEGLGCPGKEGEKPVDLALWVWVLPGSKYGNLYPYSGTDPHQNPWVYPYPCHSLFAAFDGILHCLRWEYNSHNSHMVVMWWSHDHFKSKHVFFQKVTSEILQLRKVVYNNNIYFVFFTTSINFFYKLLPEIYRGDSSPQLLEARIPFFNVVEEKSKHKNGGSCWLRGCRFLMTPALAPTTVDSLLTHTRYNTYSLIGHTFLDIPS
jgi:hypothetical protein